MTSAREADRLGRSAGADLSEDFGSLAFVVGAGLARLERLRSHIAGSRGGFFPGTRMLYEHELERTIDRHGRLLRALRNLGSTAREAGIGELGELSRRRREMSDLVRTEVGLSATTVISTDWQSPSTQHSGTPAAGRHMGSIRARHDDYKRDRHHDAAGYERDYVASLGPSGHGKRAIMTSCGMSAFTTIMTYLAMEGHLRGPVLMGRHSYHECAGLLRSALGSQLIDVDESIPGAIGTAVARHRPVAVFLDSLCNEAGVIVPDLAEACAALREVESETYLVVDNTCLSSSLLPWELASDDAAHVRLIVHESLTKYPQFGMDLTTAGLIVAVDEDAERLDRYREHLGANVAAISPIVLPPPDRTMLMRRLDRIGGNTEHLARLLAGSLDVQHGSLERHPSHRVCRGLPFRGGLLTVATADTDCDALVDAALCAARDGGVPLVAGTSFGFDTTRIYAVANERRSFLRIAVGIETLPEIDALAVALLSALSPPSGSSRVAKRSFPRGYDLVSTATYPVSGSYGRWDPSAAAGRDEET